MSDYNGNHMTDSADAQASAAAAQRSTKTGGVLVTVGAILMLIGPSYSMYNGLMRGLATGDFLSFFISAFAGILMLIGCIFLAARRPVTCFYFLSGVCALHIIAVLGSLFSSSPLGAIAPAIQTVYIAFLADYIIGCAQPKSAEAALSKRNRWFVPGILAIVSYVISLIGSMAALGVFAHPEAIGLVLSSTFVSVSGILSILSIVGVFLVCFGLRPPTDPAALEKLVSEKKPSKAGGVVGLIIIVVIIVVICYACPGSSSSSGKRKWSDLSDREKDNARWAYEVQQLIDGN